VGSAVTAAPGSVLDRLRPGGHSRAVQWTACREGDVTMARHGELGVLLRGAYSHQPQLFGGLRTWSYLRPEARVIGTDASGAAAMAGVLRRFLQVGEAEQLVAVVGLVSVRPDLQGRGVGAELMRRVGQFLGELAVPFGLLMCAEQRVRFYQRAGWHQLTPRRMVYSLDDTREAEPFADEIVGTAMILPVTEGLDEWPPGELRWHCATV
jgi:nodulation protein A